MVCYDSFFCKYFWVYMKELNRKLRSYNFDYQKVDFMYELFTQVQEKVDVVLLFGPCNNASAEKGKRTYYSRREKQGQSSFFSVQYSNDELDVLPAVIASSLSLSVDPVTMNESVEAYEHFLKSAYLYGTGTCEVYAIVGAYFLATELDVDLSIETIYSDQSHTYITLHSNPEFIMDFWSPMLCLHSDTVTWNEFFGSQYMRNSSSDIKQNIRLNKEGLLAMGERVFSEENTVRRLQIIEKVRLAVQKESTVENVSEKPSVALGFSGGIGQ
jgi:hypothetical protein